MLGDVAVVANAREPLMAILRRSAEHWKSKPGTDFNPLGDALRVAAEADPGVTTEAFMAMRGLRVFGNLNLDGIHGLSGLPPGLFVSGSLSLRGTSIHEIPAGVVVGGILHVGDLFVAKVDHGLKAQWVGVDDPTEGPRIVPTHLWVRSLAVITASVALAEVETDRMAI
jgi:hypothetical protein